jgi:hypothetical protein
MKTSSNEENEFSRLLTVMGYIAVKDSNSISEKVSILEMLGFTNKEMAKICGTTDGTIKVQKVLNKKTKKKKAK